MSSFDKEKENSEPILDISDIMESSVGDQTYITRDGSKGRSPIGVLYSMLDGLIKSLISGPTSSDLKSSSIVTTQPIATSTQPIATLKQPIATLTQPSSLISIVISSHSETTQRTYEDNFKYKNAYFKFKFNNYDDRILKEYHSLLNTDKREIITAVSQGICAMADSTADNLNEYEDKYTRDAENMLIMYDKSKDFLGSIKSKSSNNKSLIRKYISEIKDTLQYKDLIRYTNALIDVYIVKVSYIIKNIDYLIEVSTNILKIKLNDAVIQKSITDLEICKTFYLTLSGDLKIIKDHKNIVTRITTFDEIIKQQKKFLVEWKSKPNSVSVSEDIYNIVLLHNIIINVILINKNIINDADIIKKINAIDKTFRSYTKNAAENGLPLFVEEENDLMIFYEGVLKNSFWRSEDHNLSFNDTKFQFDPNSDETQYELDCNYGLNMFALMLNLNSSPPSNKSDLFLPKLKPHTREAQKEKVEKGPELTGKKLLDTPEWRYHNLQIEKYDILDKIVYIFKKNFLERILDNTKPIIEQTPIVQFIFYTLDNEILSIKTSLGFKSEIFENYKTDVESLNNSAVFKDSKGFPLNVMDIDKKYLKELKSITNEDDPILFTYCRVLEFNDFLRRILVGNPDELIIGTNGMPFKDRNGRNIKDKYFQSKVILLSELMYLFQYLLKFDYVIYILTSCRVCQIGQKPKSITRYGGNTYKQRKTYKRKTNKRKVCKRKTYKRKTYKRKRLNRV